MACLIPKALPSPPSLSFQFFLSFTFVIHSSPPFLASRSLSIPFTSLPSPLPGLTPRLTRPRAPSPHLLSPSPSLAHTLSLLPPLPSTPTTQPLYARSPPPPSYHKRVPCSQLHPIPRISRIPLQCPLQKELSIYGIITHCSGGAGSAPPM